MDIPKVRKSFDKNGFVVLEGLLSHSDVETVKQSILKAFNDSLECIGHKKQVDIQLSVKELFSTDYDRYVNVVTSLYRKLSVQNLVLNDLIISTIKNIFNWDEIYLAGGTSVHVVSDSIRTKGRYMGIQPHQDFPSVQGSLDGMIIWIPLMKVDENSYPMEVIKGSHNSGVYPAYEDGVNPDWEIKPEYLINETFHPVHCNPGDVVLMSNFAIHRTGQYGNDDIRVACSTRVDNGNEKTFVFRSFPSAYKRVVERRQLHKIEGTEFNPKI
jgi:ectoine hydroxylase-related dioxygenase (phytanoyl-CoA dioxygenase family)